MTKEIGQEYYPRYETNFDVENPGSFYLDPDPVPLEFLTSIKSGGNILELAAGDGRYTLPMLEKGFSVTATDLQEEPLRVLKEKSLRRGFQRLAAISQFNAFDTFPFAEEAFDGVVCTGFLYLFPQEYIESVIGEASRILTDQGVFIFDFVTDIERKNSQGDIVRGEKEMQYTVASGLQTINTILKANALQPNIVINSLNQVFTGGTSIKGNKLNIAARKIKPI